MAEKIRIAESTTGQDHDNAVVHRGVKVWLTRAALLATGAALLATSAPAQYYYRFSKTVAAPSIELTQAAPRARFTVTARALELAPNAQPTTNQAHATVSALIRQPVGAQSFVAVRLSNADGSLPDELSVLSDFRLPRELTFSGDCVHLDPGAPCEAKFVVELERSDGGSAGGSVSVSWSIELAAQTAKSGRDEGPLDLPWSVEVSPQ